MRLRTVINLHVAVAHEIKLVVGSSHNGRVFSLRKDERTGVRGDENGTNSTSKRSITTLSVSSGYVFREGQAI